MKLTFKTCDVVSLGLKSKHSEFYIEIKALEFPTICSPIQGHAVRWAKNQYNYIKRLNLADYTQETKTELEVDLLRADFMWHFMTNEVVNGESEQTPVAVGTDFGWVLSGPVPNIPRSLLSSVNLTATHVLRADCQTPVADDYQESVDKSMEQRVNYLFELEALGITELDSVHETFIKDIQFENNHSTVKLPRSEYHDVLPDNFDLSAGRLISTLK